MQLFKKRSDFILSDI